MKDISGDGEELLKFPVAYPIKVVGRRSESLRANPEWRYVPVRRTAIFIEESVFGGIQWAVFEPNDHRLWSSLRANIDAIVRQHVPDLDDSQITERASNQAHFLSITYTINAQSREQVVALATALQASSDVIMLI